MADDAATEIAKNVLKNMVPLEGMGKIADAAQGAQDSTMRLLQSLGIIKPPPPPLNAPLPRMNPATGQVDFPPGYQGPR